MTETITQPQSVITFDPSQRRFFDDASRTVIALWHRRKGKDFVAAAVAVDDAMKRGGDWWIVGMTQTQADETYAKVLRVIDAYKMLLSRLFGSDRVEQESEPFEDYSHEIREKFHATNRMVRLPNGARVGSLPGRNPDTLAGRGGSMIWTEFGLFEGGGYKHWRVLHPIITRGGHKLRIISTPRGKNTKFYEAWTSGEYSNHFCDIHQSVRQEGYEVAGPDGIPLDTSTPEKQDAAIEYMKRQYGDPIGWEREFECKFSGDSAALITWAELERAASLANPDGFVYRRINGQQGTSLYLDGFMGALAGKRIAIGWDVARRGHLSVITVNLLEHNRPDRLAAVVAMRDCSFEFMRSAVITLMDTTRHSVGYGDATGLGMESNEVLENKYRDRWTPHTFTATGKREVASALKTAFSDGTQTIPPMDGPHKFVATDLYAIQADQSGASLVISETPNPLMDESHCDIAYSLGLARLAGAKNARAPLPPPRARKPAGW